MVSASVLASMFFHALLPWTLSNLNLFFPKLFLAGVITTTESNLGQCLIKYATEGRREEWNAVALMPTLLHSWACRPCPVTSSRDSRKRDEVVGEEMTGLCWCLQAEASTESEYLAFLYNRLD